MQALACQSMSAISLGRSRRRRRADGRSSSMSGRRPVVSRSWSQMASLSLSAPNWLCVIVRCFPVNSQASVPPAAMCLRQSIARAPA
jgi:hypothetical protein